MGRVRSRCIRNRCQRGVCTNAAGKSGHTGEARVARSRRCGVRHQLATCWNAQALTQHPSIDAAHGLQSPYALCVSPSLWPSLCLVARTRRHRGRPCVHFRSPKWMKRSKKSDRTCRHLLSTVTRSCRTSGQSLPQRQSIANSEAATLAASSVKRVTNAAMSRCTNAPIAARRAESAMCGSLPAM